MVVPRYVDLVDAGLKKPGDIKSGKARYVSVIVGSEPKLLEGIERDLRLIVIELVPVVQAHPGRVHFIRSQHRGISQSVKVGIGRARAVLLNGNSSGANWVLGAG